MHYLSPSFPTFGAGTDLGDETYAVYDGVGDSVTMTYAANDTYSFRVFENDDMGAGSVTYLTGTATGTPNSSYVPVAVSAFAVE